MNWFPLHIGENRIGGCGDRFVDRVTYARSQSPPKWFLHLGFFSQKYTTLDSEDFLRFLSPFHFASHYAIRLEIK